MTLINRREMGVYSRFNPETWADEFFNGIEQRGEFTEQDLDWLYQNKKLSAEHEDHWDQWSEEVMTTVSGRPAILPTKLTRDPRPPDEEPSLSNKNTRDDFDRFVVHLCWPVEVPEAGVTEPRGALIELEIAGRRPSSWARTSIGGDPSTIVFEDV